MGNKKNLYTSLLLFSLFFSFQFASSLQHSPASSPAPLPADDISSPPITSPPAPSPSDLSPSPSPDADDSPEYAPVPEPSEASDVMHGDVIENEGERKETSSSSGMSGGKKVGITFAVLMGAAVVGVGGFVYKKRKDNMRRSSYGEAARSRGDIL